MSRSPVGYLNRRFSADFVQQEAEHVEFDMLQKFSEHVTADDRARVQRQLGLQANEQQRQWYFFRQISGYIKIGSQTTQETESIRCTNRALGFLSLYKKDININYTERSDGWTLLHTAAYFNNVTAVRFILLIYKDVHIDALDKYGLTALDLAIERQNSEIITALEAFKGLSEENREVEEFSEKYEMMRSKYVVYMEALRECSEGDEEKVKEVMRVMKK
ncbi:ankyrin repeat domain protein, partial [Reticulomyxa filosa]